MGDHKSLNEYGYAAIENKPICKTKNDYHACIKTSSKWPTANCAHLCV